MGHISRFDGSPTKLPSNVKDPKGGIQGVRVENRTYVVKSEIWNRAKVPVRLANEGLFFAVGKANALPMPNSALIHMNGANYWGTEYVEGWNEFTAMGKELTAQQTNAVEAVFATSESERKSYLRAILLDVALLNSDRTPWNVLFNTKDGALCFRYFDHDRSFGWHGDFNPNYLDKIGISSVAAHTYLKCASFNRAALKSSTREELVSVFNALSLDIAVLRSARAELPAEWIAEANFRKLTGILEAWWEHLRANFEQSIVDEMLAVSP